MDFKTQRKVDVEEYFSMNEEAILTRVIPKREPAVLRKWNLGDCVCNWTPDYLASKVGSVEVKVHVTTNPRMDFINKNFAYKTLPFNELFRRCFQETHEDYFFDKNEKYYLRSLGDDPRKGVADVNTQFPQLAPDLRIPSLYDPDRFFSSVFRIGSAGVQLWTHYDIMDNILMQISGRKRVVLFSPRDALNLYLEGDKSRVLDIDAPDQDQYPRFSRAKMYETVLEPGDVLFIPALWFHNTLALDPNVAVNVFWRHLNRDCYDTKDIYGNKDLNQASRALNLLDKAIKLIEELPDDYRDFYARRMIGKLQNKALL